MSKVTKCDFCSYAVRRFGKLCCPWSNSLLTQDDINELLNLLIRGKLL